MATDGSPSRKQKSKDTSPKKGKATNSKTSAKKEMKKEKTGKGNSNKKPGRKKTKLTPQAYKVGHNIGRRSATEKVFSYNENEIAVSYCESYWPNTRKRTASPTKDDENAKKQRKDESTRMYGNKTRATGVKQKVKKPEIKPRAPRIQREAYLNAGAIMQLMYDSSPVTSRQIKQEPKSSTESENDTDYSSSEEITVKPSYHVPKPKPKATNTVTKDKKSRTESKGSPKESKDGKEKRSSPTRAGKDKKGRDSSPEKGGRKCESPKKATDKLKKRKILHKGKDKGESCKRKRQIEAPLWPPPKRMACLNATAIMAASTKKWKVPVQEHCSRVDLTFQSLNLRRRHNILTESQNQKVACWVMGLGSDVLSGKEKLACCHDDGKVAAGDLSSSGTLDVITVSCPAKDFPEKKPGHNHTSLCPPPPPSKPTIPSPDVQIVDIKEPTSKSSHVMAAPQKLVSTHHTETKEHPDGTQAAHAQPTVVRPDPITHHPMCGSHSHQSGPMGNVCAYPYGHPISAVPTSQYEAPGGSTSTFCPTTLSTTPGQAQSTSHTSNFSYHPTGYNSTMQYQQSGYNCGYYQQMGPMMAALHDASVPSPTQGQNQPSQNLKAPITHPQRSFTPLDVKPGLAGYSASPMPNAQGTYYNSQISQSAGGCTLVPPSGGSSNYQIPVNQPVPPFYHGTTGWGQPPNTGTQASQQLKAFAKQTYPYPQGTPMHSLRPPAAHAPWVGHMPSYAWNRSEGPHSSSIQQVPTAHKVWNQPGGPGNPYPHQAPNMNYQAPPPQQNFPANQAAPNMIQYMGQPSSHIAQQQPAFQPSYSQEQQQQQKTPVPQQLLGSQVTHPVIIKDSPPNDGKRSSTPKSAAKTYHLMELHSQVTQPRPSSVKRQSPKRATDAKESSSSKCAKDQKSIKPDSKDEASSKPDLICVDVEDKSEKEDCKSVTQTKMSGVQTGELEAECCTHDADKSDDGSIINVDHNESHSSVDPSDKVSVTAISSDDDLVILDTSPSKEENPISAENKPCDHVTNTHSDQVTHKLGDHVTNTQGDHVTNTQGDHVTHTPGDHVTNTPGDHVTNTQGDHVTDTPSDHVTNTGADNLKEDSFQEQDDKKCCGSQGHCDENQGQLKVTIVSGVIKEEPPTPAADTMEKMETKCNQRFIGKEEDNKCKGSPQRLVSKQEDIKCKGSPQRLVSKQEDIKCKGSPQRLVSKQEDIKCKGSPKLRDSIECKTKEYAPIPGKDCKIQIKSDRLETKSVKEISVQICKLDNVPMKGNSKNMCPKLLEQAKIVGATKFSEMHANNFAINTDAKLKCRETMSPGYLECNVNCKTDNTLTRTLYGTAANNKVDIYDFCDSDDSMSIVTKRVEPKVGFPKMCLKTRSPDLVEGPKPVRGSPMECLTVMTQYPMKLPRVSPRRSLDNLTPTSSQDSPNRTCPDRKTTNSPLDRKSTNSPKRRNSKSNEESKNPRRRSDSAKPNPERSVSISRRRTSLCGWRFQGEPKMMTVPSVGEGPQVERKTYPAIGHNDGDVVRVRDCVLVKSGPRKRDVPYVAKVAAIWEADGDMLMSVLWYYRPEHTETERLPHFIDCELFASKHKDEISVACIEDKCYVLTFAEYCRYQAQLKMQDEKITAKPSVVPASEEEYPRKQRLPPLDASQETIFLCRRVYDLKLKRILKNPS